MLVSFRLEPAAGGLLAPTVPESPLQPAGRNGP